MTTADQFMQQQQQEVGCSPETFAAIRGEQLEHALREVAVYRGAYLELTKAANQAIQERDERIAELEEQLRQGATDQ